MSHEITTQEWVSEDTLRLAAQIEIENDQYGWTKVSPNDLTLWQLVSKQLDTGEDALNELYREIFAEEFENYLMDC